MRWVRLDSTFHSNPKVLDLIAAGRHRALVAYICGLGYAGQHSTEGRIPRAALSVIHARPVDVSHLIAAELWHPNGGDGWIIHDWHDYQPRAEAPIIRQQRAREAANVRWHGTKAAP